MGQGFPRVRGFNTPAFSTSKFRGVVNSGTIDSTTRRIYVAEEKAATRTTTTRAYEP